ncbi:transposase [Bacteroidia bacterium]|nr:transposase [Bacteroidia bacterium]
MAQSLSQLYVHCIFHVKYNTDKIRPEDEAELYAYIGGIIKNIQSIPIKINGTANHLHILAAMSKNISLADFMMKIKANSSRWLKTKNEYYDDFEWQGGYAGYSVSQSKLKVVATYIEKQKEHHNEQTFIEEYIQFLKENNVNFNEKYLWTE